GDFHADPRTVLPRADGRDREVLREATGPMDPDDLQVVADVPEVVPALVALPAGNVAFDGHEVAVGDPLDAAAGLDDFAGDLVAQDEGGLDDALRPVVPLVDVQVGPADRRRLALEQDVV